MSSFPTKVNYKITGEKKGLCLCFKDDSHMQKKIFRIMFILVHTDLTEKGQTEHLAI